MKKIILIGGAPATGKTTLAKAAAVHLHVPWISTDQIREMLKTVTDVESHPELFVKYDGTDIEELVALEQKQSEVIWNALLQLINHGAHWGGCIIEGMAILPHLVHRDASDRSQIQPLFLLHRDAAAITRVVSERSKLPWIKTKTPEQQERKVRQIALFDTKIREAAEAYGYPCIKQVSLEESLRELVDIIEKK